MPKIQLQAADIHEIIKLALNPFRGIFSEIRFITQFEEDIPSPIQVDPEQMRRVFINLIDNAIDAMRKQGEILMAGSVTAEALQQLL